MIFMSDDFPGSGVFSASLVKPFVGDPMIKLIATALLSIGIASAAMAADTPSTGSSASAPAASSTSKSTHKHSGKKSKKSTSAPSKS